MAHEGKVVPFDPAFKKSDPAIKDVIERLRPFLSEYLEMRGVVFDPHKKDKFHCFNAAQHTGGVDQHASGSLHSNGTRYKCFACDAKGDIIEACRILEGRSVEGKEFIETIKYLAAIFKIPFPENESFKPARKKSEDKLDREFFYTDEQGEKLYKSQRVLRYENGQPVKDDAGKHMKVHYLKSFAGRSWVNGLDKGARRVLYHLPEVLEAVRKSDFIFFVEGEKCADIIKNELKLTATTIVSGAQSWIKPHKAGYISSLQGARLIILPDNDTAGRKLAEEVASDVAGITSFVKIVELPGLPTKGDIEQWLQMNPENPAQELLNLVNTTPEWNRSKNTSDVENPVFSHKGAYFRKGRIETKCISNFVIHPIHRVIPENGNCADEQWRVRVEACDGTKIDQVITLEAFVNKNALKRQLMHSAFSFTGSDDDAQSIKVLFSAEPHDETRGVSCIGFHADNKNNDSDALVFVSNTQAIRADGSISTDVVMLENDIEITTDLLEASTIAEEKLPDLTKALFSFNSLEKCVVLLGWCASCFLIGHFQKLNIKTPHLFIYGEAGSGKSETVERILMPLFGNPRKYSVRGTTNFATLKTSSSSNVIPFIIDEYKPHFLTDSEVGRISDLLRNTYDHSSSSKGQTTMATKKFKALAPVCLIGEEGSEEPALKERGLELLFSKRSLTSDVFFSSFQSLKRSVNSIRALGRSLLETAMEITPDLVGAWYDDASKSITPSIRAKMPGLPPRVENSICCCIAGLRLIETVLCKADLDIEQIIGVDFIALENALLQAVFENTMDSRATSKSAVDNILEAMSRMANSGAYTAGKHFQLINDDSELALDISSMYDVFKKYRREHDLKIENLEQGQFTKQLREKSFWTDYRTVKFRYEQSGCIPEATRKRAYVVNFALLRAQIGEPCFGFIKAEEEEDAIDYEE